MLQVLVVSQHAQAYRDLLSARPLDGVSLRYAATTAEALKHCETAEILFGAPDLLAPLLPECPALRWLQSSWAGVTPLIKAERKDYLLTGVKDLFGPAMSEYVLGWLLALERNIPHHSLATAWTNRPEGSVSGKHLGIMGTGSIGRAVARAATALDMKCIGLNTSGQTPPEFLRCYANVDRLSFARDLDYLVALLPDTKQTDGLIDQHLLEALPADVILINAGRGNAVDMPALLQALASGKLRHAVLDVLVTEPLPPSDPLWHTEGLTLTSHTAAPTPVDAIIDVFRDNLARYQQGQPLAYQVDFERGY